jgi:hypothetical protein
VTSSYLIIQRLMTLITSCDMGVKRSLRTGPK